jgi:hypothetical protein
MRSDGSVVVECKTSRSDFFADRKKPHMLDEKWGMGRHRYYLVPHGLVSADEVPAWCGLAYAKARTVELVKEAPRRDIHTLAAVNECMVLASAVRRHVLKVPFIERTGRFETIEARDLRKKREADGHK